MNGPRRTSRIVALACVAAIALLAGCGGSKPGAGPAGTELTIAGYKEPTGNIQQIINTWNNTHPQHKARYVELPTAADAQHQQLAQNFLAHSSAYDVVVADDTWIDEFASKNWLMPLPANQFPLGQMFPASVRAGTYDGRQYAIPFTASAEVLYYRTDLVSSPPTTWAQLLADCARVRGIGCYGGQFAQYEGLTISFMSAVASAGGSVLSADGKRVEVDSPQAAEGLSFLTNGFARGYIPKEAITWQEQESGQAFEQGKLMFLVNYPFVYQLANTSGANSSVAGKVGVAALPGLSGPGVVVTGGHMMGVSAYSTHQTDAQAFVRFFTSEQNARQLLLKVGYAPVWRSLYSDRALIRQLPYLPIIGTELRSAIIRPRTSDYVALTLVIQKNTYPALQGSVSPSQALHDMSDQLRATLSGN